VGVYSRLEATAATDWCPPTHSPELRLAVATELLRDLRALEQLAVPDDEFAFVPFSSHED
jgi:hypothetical protein